MLREGRVAYVWERRTRAGVRSELRLDGPSPGSQLLDSTPSRDGSSRELSPVFTAGVLSWARREGSMRSRFEVFGLSSHQLDAYLAPAAIEAFATNHFVVLNHLATGEAVYAYQEAHTTVTIRRLVTHLRELPAQTSE